MAYTIHTAMCLCKAQYMVLSSHAGPLHCCPVMYRLNVSVRGAWYPCIVCYPPLHPCTSLYPYPCILLSCHIPLYGAAMHTVLSGRVQPCTPEWQVDENKWDLLGIHFRKESLLQSRRLGHPDGLNSGLFRSEIKGFILASTFRHKPHTCARSQEK